MPKWVQLPGNLGLDPEFSPEEVVRCLEVAQDVRIVGRGFIRGDQPAVHELKLAVLDQTFDCFAVLLQLQAHVVSTEISDVAQRVCVLLVSLQLREDILEYERDLLEVLVIRLQPPCVHV